MNTLVKLTGIGFSTFGLVLFAGVGCAVSDPMESDATDDKAPSVEPSVAKVDGRWTEVSPGIRLADDGETRSWIVQGTEGRAVLRQDIEQRLAHESEPKLRQFYANFLADLDGVQKEDGQELQKMILAPSAQTANVNISEIPGGLTASAHASRGWGYVKAEVYVNVNDNVRSDMKNKSDTCISSCSVTVTQSVTSCPNASTSCYAMARAMAGGTVQLVERYSCSSITCPAVCCPKTECLPGECGYIPDSCGSSIYCGPCGGGGGACWFKADSDDKLVLECPYAEQ